MARKKQLNTKKPINSEVLNLLDDSGTVSQSKYSDSSDSE